MDHSIVRPVAHLLLISWGVTIIISVIKLRGHSIKLVWWWIAVVGMGCFVLWVIGLVLSMKEGGLIDRALLVPTLAPLELGAGAFAWLWFVLSVPHNFTFEKRVPIVDPS